MDNGLILENSVWIAVKADDEKTVADVLGFEDKRLMDWEGGVQAAWSSGIKSTFIFPAANGWVLIFSGEFNDLPPLEENSVTMKFLVYLSELFPEVQYFGCFEKYTFYRAWALLRVGKVIRMVVNNEHTLVKKGRITPDERKLGLTFDEDDEIDYNHVLEIAEAWSINPENFGDYNSKGVGFLVSGWDFLDWETD